MAFPALLSVSMWFLSFVHILSLLAQSTRTTGLQSENSIEPDQTLSLEYPVILNYEVDKAVFIIPHKGCRVVTQREEAQSIDLQRVRNIYKEDRETVNEIISLCEQYQNETISATQFLVGVRDAAIFIYPGTKWCGVGNRATNTSDLGINQKTDKCCRDHDSCTDYVEAFGCHSSIGGLCNRSPFTRSNCDCDEGFRRCLLETNEYASRRIGILFFTAFGLKCFRQDYPILGCLEYGGFLNIHCQKYELNYTGSPLYQFFDSPKFSFNNSVIFGDEEANATILGESVVPVFLQ